MTDPDAAPAGAGGARVRLAAVGLGRWARVITRAYAGSEVAELRTCYTRNPERRAAFAAEFGCGQEESLAAVLARDDVDALVVTAPNDQHAPIIEAAAAAGKHVYTEKPVAVGLADVRRIRRAVGAARIVFACGHSARRLAGLRTMKRLIASGETGSVSMAEAVFGNERGLELKEGDWRADPAASPGGPLTQLGIHQIDNLQYLLGPARRAFAMGQAPLPGIANELAVGVLLEFADSLGYLGCNWLSPGSFTVDLYGTAARLRFELDFSWWSKSAQTDAHTRLTRTVIAADSANPDARVLRTGELPLPRHDHLREQIEEFARAIQGTAEVEVGLAEAVSNVAVLQAAARSLASGRPVEVDEILAEIGD
ncbi:MAG: Gfo/Idh/MocA family oxidoreductase [Actinobacteria bacterium]|nr:Gfo/Idh/MocA family oxidoreductase [Actinomycetota bacterium]MBO0814496.1 Gfo/Idh/MocA family oxidoreductase [Actinomycetota bacterium]